MLAKGVDNCERGDIKALYFEAKVLISGASGFVGKVLIESLLRKTEVEKIFVIIRSKKDISTHERLKGIMKEPIFQRLKRENPDRLKALIPISGDVGLPDLGISDADREILIDEVEIVFHAAATVKFNENLKLATEINVSGTNNLMCLAREMKNLKVIMHVSTAYSNMNLEEIDEKVYSSNDKINIIQMTEAIDQETAHNITNEIIQDLPNTYVYTKRVAEVLIERDFNDLPVGILRPGIVLGALQEPLPGWVDNHYGPTGIVLGLIAGAVHVTAVKKDATADIVPVDYVTNCLISAAWDTYSRFIMNGKEKRIPVYNVVSSPVAPLTWGTFQGDLIRLGRKRAPNRAVWHPFVFSTTFRPIFCFSALVLHYFPAVVFDALWILSGKRTKWVRYFRKMSELMPILIPFSTNSWVFKIDSVDALWNEMSRQEQQLFPFSFEGFDWDRYLRIYFEGVNTYLMKNTIPEHEAVKVAKRLFFYHYLFISALFAIIGVLIF